MLPAPTAQPLLPAERRATRSAPSPEEMEAIREELRLDAEWTEALIAKYGHPFENAHLWPNSLPEDSETA
jgi:hypothetical protein